MSCILIESYPAASRHINFELNGLLSKQGDYKIVALDYSILPKQSFIKQQFH